MKTLRLDAEALSHLGQILALDASALGRSFAETDPTDQITGGVGLLDISGPLAHRPGLFSEDYESLTRRVADVAADADAIVMRIDSPGGDVDGLAQAIDAMKRATSDTHVIAYVDEYAASAAYWIAAEVADEIVLPANGRVGSIGTVAARVDLSDDRVHVYRKPAGKAESMPLGPVNALADERIQAMVDESADEFISAIASARGLDEKTVSGFNGALFRGQSSVDVGLADRVGSLDEALKTAATIAKGKQIMTKGIEALTAALGMPKDSDVADVLASAAASVAHAKLGAQLLEATGEATSSDALACIERWRCEASEAAAIKAQAAEQLAAAETASRDTLCEALVKAGRAPVAVWVDPLQASDRAKRKPRGLYAKCSLEDLKDEVAAAEADSASHTHTEAKAVADGGPSGLSEIEIYRQEAKARAAGGDPAEFVKQYAAIKARLNGESE